MSAQELHDEAWRILEAVPGINVYDGEVPGNPPLDPDRRVHAYAVLYASPGQPEALMLDDEQDSLDGGFQITCVGGDPARALWCLDRVRAAFIGAEVTVGGHAHRITASEIDPGNVRRDDDVKPSRHYVPQLFDVFIP